MRLGVLDPASDAVCGFLLSDQDRRYPVPLWKRSSAASKRRSRVRQQKLGRSQHFDRRADVPL